MEICGEHGFSNGSEIAYSGNNCPACTQIEELRNEYEQKIEVLESDNDSLADEVAEIQSQLDTLQG